MIKRGVVVIGAGPAGLAAALAAKENGAQDVLILERDTLPGGILKQCIHPGFGLHVFGEELTGPEYADIFWEKVQQMDIECITEAMVLSVNEKRVVTAVSKKQGVMQIEAQAVILAMGCRERSRGAIGIAGTRPAGVFTAGTAQRFVNIEGYLPGRNVVILGSGDIGLIMARRMTLEGANVSMVLEVLPFSGGLKRNIVQCLDDFDIPLKLSHTVVEILGTERVEGVVIAQVDENLKPIPETFETIECDTVLLSVGLIPENEITEEAGIVLNRITNGPVVNQNMETEIEGIFACGNVLHVHDLVDFVSEESALAGAAAAKFVNGQKVVEQEKLTIESGDGVRYVVPNTLCTAALLGKEKLLFRVDQVYNDIKIELLLDGATIFSKKKDIVAPGEMESIPLKPELVDKLKGKTLTVRLVT